MHDEKLLLRQLVQSDRGKDKDRVKQLKLKHEERPKQHDKKQVLGLPTIDEVKAEVVGQGDSEGKQQAADASHGVRPRFPPPNYPPTPPPPAGRQSWEDLCDEDDDDEAHLSDLSGRTSSVGSSSQAGSEKSAQRRRRRQRLADERAGAARQQQQGEEILRKVLFELTSAVGGVEQLAPLFETMAEDERQRLLAMWQGTG